MMDILSGKKILVTAGPTYESIDPVRFIGNRSSGKMGIEIVQQLLRYDVEIYLILGPVSIPIPKHPRLHIHQVESAEEMYLSAMAYQESIDIGIFAAAVADYTPVDVALNKIKKNEETFTLQLKKTKDILKSFGNSKLPFQTLIGFALETNDEASNAMKKIISKNLDFIILNSLQDSGAGFKHATNLIKIIDKSNKISPFELKQKSEVAADIIQYLVQYLEKNDIKKS